jgi:hypothetical protein
LAILIVAAAIVMGGKTSVLIPISHR